jgi:hypothetical protein
MSGVEYPHTVHPGGVVTSEDLLLGDQVVPLGLLDCPRHGGLIDPEVLGDLLLGAVSGGT